MVNPIFKSEKVKSFINDLIIVNKYRHFLSVHLVEKDELAALLMEAANDIECITENSNLGSICLAIRKSLNGTLFNDEDLVQTIKASVTTYYDEIMEELFYETLDEYQTEIHESRKNAANYNYGQHYSNHMSAR